MFLSLCVLYLLFLSLCVLYLHVLTVPLSLCTLLTVPLSLCTLLTCTYCSSLFVYSTYCSSLFVYSTYCTYLHVDWIQSVHHQYSIVFSLVSLRGVSPWWDFLRYWPSCEHLCSVVSALQWFCHLHLQDRDSVVTHNNRQVTRTWMIMEYTDSLDTQPRSQGGSIEHPNLH